MVDDREDEGRERSRPRVVDKRVSSGGHNPAPEPTPVAEPTAESQGGPPSEAPAAPTENAAPRPAGEDRVWTPEQEAEARQIAQEIAKTPSAEWVINSAVQLINVAATKLDLGSPAEAQLPIDALDGILNSVGPRLGDVEAPLRQTVAQLKLAYSEKAMGATAQSSGPPPAGS